MENPKQICDAFKVKNGQALFGIPTLLLGELFFGLSMPFHGVTVDTLSVKSAGTVLSGSHLFR